MRCKRHKFDVILVDKHKAIPEYSIYFNDLEYICAVNVDKGNPCQVAFVTRPDSTTSDTFRTILMTMD
ncbi:hypothetical protein RUND412_008728, partial [Rhizina undulata]